MALSDSCRHGMPVRLGCDDCLISDLDMRVRELEIERDAARNALNHVLQRTRRAVAAEREACAALMASMRAKSRNHLFRSAISIAEGEIRARGKP